MSDIKQNSSNWKEKLNNRRIIAIITIAIIIVLSMAYYIYKRENEFKQASENTYNMAFFEVIDYVENVETYLAKSTISTTPEHGAETLTHLWREANLAQAYLTQLPISSNELANTEKFLNQVSDYSYALSRKNINNESLTQEDFANLEELHNYSVELENTLNQLSADMNDGRISWQELAKKENQGNNMFATQVSNISKDSFSNLEENFHEYAGLIYDGAFSEHLTSVEKKGLTGEDVDEETATKKVNEFFGEDRIEKIEMTGLSENTDMPSYSFNITVKNPKNKENNTATMSITKKGGHIVYMNYNRNVEATTITNERANQIGKEFLDSREIPNMKQTYYLEQGGILTINYAYEQILENGSKVLMYPDLIKLKIALDNGEILGMETSGYLNSHMPQRTLPEVQITQEQAKETLNKNLNIESQQLAVIPTEFQTELYCWEFKGKVNETEYLVYINAQTGKEEDILVIKNTPNGILTM